ncbi:MAG: sporulation initiation factor Spo0A C-terminal domain-containing protein, partial [Oscillospiraceae bacterium]
GLEDLYAHVAEASHTTASRVERAIGHAIAIAWGGDAELLPSCGSASPACGRTPTNADCIAHLAGQLQSQRKTALPC